MKKFYSLVIVLLAFMTILVAQPQKMTYQTVVRDNNNELVVNQQVGIQVSIIRDSANGPVVYRETHLANTNVNGLVSIVIGEGVNPFLTTMADVKWGEYDHYLRVDIDPAGGINYTISGTQQLMTVPYAFYSESARYVDTALYAANALHADTAYYLANLQNSDTALFAYNSDTAVFANNANNAVNANYATSAGSATTATSATYADSTQVADFAHNAQYSNSAAFANNAQYSDTAMFAYNAAHSDTALYAGTANMSNYADSTRIAAYADTADYNKLLNRPTGTNMGDILYWDTATTSWHILPAGNIGEILTMDSNYVPHWNTGGGNQITLPTVQTDSVINVLGVSATAIGTVTDGGGTTLVFGGICWGTQHNPSLSDNYLSSGIGVNSYTSQLTGLSPNTTYYVRAFATNNAGTVYGAELTFTTLITLPSVTTEKVIAINGTAATSGGDVTSDGGDSVSARGVCWSISSNPTISSAHTVDGSGTGAFASSITGLVPGQTYYVRSYATNTLGTAYGDEITYTSPTVPTVITDSIVSITSSTAVAANNITSDGGAPPTARGICYGLSASPTLVNNYTTDGSGTGTYLSTITGLSPTTMYFTRAYATNIAGTGYDNTPFNFYYDDGYNWWSVSGEGGFILTAPLASSYDTAHCPGIPTVTDNDGNVYNTIQIGTQCWMKENLRTTTYGSNISIPLGTTTSSTVAYRYYPDNDSSNVKDYGYLYNGTAALLTICPAGWHVPTGGELGLLASYAATKSSYNIGTFVLSLSSKAVASTTGWTNQTQLGPGNTQVGNNVTGFTAMPAGYYESGNYYNIHNYACFWSSSYTSNYIFGRYLYGTSFDFSNTNFQYASARSIRCIKDNSYQDGQPCPGATTVTDLDNNVYNTVQIGAQCWMKENLRTTQYPDGTSITFGNGGTSTSTGYCYHVNNNSANDVTFGLLYNWSAAMNYASSSAAVPSGVRGICPNGWHIPSRNEFMALINYVGSGQYLCNSNAVTGQPLASNSNWNYYSSTCAVGYNLSSNNATGYSAQPAGWFNSSYNYINTRSYIWSTTEPYSGDYSYCFYMSNSSSSADYYNTYNKYYGMSVRCLKD